jgi:hypothetical protein
LLDLASLQDADSSIQVELRVFRGYCPPKSTRKEERRPGFCTGFSCPTPTSFVWEDPTLKVVEVDESAVPLLEEESQKPSIIV